VSLLRSSDGKFSASKRAGFQLSDTRWSSGEAASFTTVNLSQLPTMLEIFKSRARESGRYGHGIPRFRDRKAVVLPL